MRRIATALVLLLTASPLLAAVATVCTVEAERLEGEITAISADGAVEFVRAGKTVRLPPGSVHRIRFREMPKPPAFEARVLTVQGTVLLGKLVGSKATLGIKTPVMKQAMRLGADDLLGVLFAGDERATMDPARFEEALARPGREADVIFVASPKGIVPLDVAVSSVAPDKVRFTWQQQERSVDTAKVAAIVFAGGAATPEDTATTRLTDGSVLRGGVASLEKDLLTLDVSGQAVVVPVAGVVAVEFANPGITYLSALKPAAVRETPFFNRVWKHRLDRSVGGGPLSLDGRTYTRGIGCHTRTELTYDLGGSYRKFAAVIGIDDEARPRGSVKFIVRLDGRELLARVLGGRDRALPVVLDVAGGRRLTLIADFAEDAHVGDHADWADARLVK